MVHAKRSSTLLSGMLILCVISAAQSGYQMLLDTATGLRRGIVTENGSIVLALVGEEKTVFWMGDEDGTPQHVFSANTGTAFKAFEMCTRPGGGFYCAGLSAHEVFYDLLGEDSLAFSIKLCGFTATGQMDLCSVFSFSERDEDWWLDVGLDIAANTSGLYLSVNDGQTSNSSVWMLKISISGELNWCKQLRMGSSDFNDGYNYTYKMEPTDDGGVFLARDNTPGPGTSNLLICRLDPSGEVAWANDYSYTGGWSDLRLADMMITSSGAPVCFGSLSGDYGYVLSVDPDGGQAQGHFYDFGTSMPFFKSGQALNDGSIRLITGTDFDDPKRAEVVQLGEDFGVQLHQRTEITQIGQVDNSLYTTSIANIGSSAVIMGSLRSEDRIFGTTAYQPTVWEIDLADPVGCMLSDSTVFHYPIPSALLSTAPVEPVVDTFVTPVVTVQMLDTVQEQLITVGDLCQLLVSTPEVPHALEEIGIYPNPAEQGGTFQVHCEHAFRISVFNSSGALVKYILKTTGSGVVAIISSGFPAGLYSVVAFDKDGRRLATAKLEVE